MWLIHEDRSKDGRWQIAWMWLPHFLALDKDLHKFVSMKMTEEFKGTMLEDSPDEQPPSMTPILERMHQKVIDLILERYSIPGLRQFLEGYIHLQEENTDDVATQD